MLLYRLRYFTDVGGWKGRDSSTAATEQQHRSGVIRAPTTTAWVSQTSTTAQAGLRRTLIFPATNMLMVGLER